MAEQRTVDGRYRLDKVVGSGGMGVVWRAFDLRLGRTVAVKEVRFPSTMTDDERVALTKRAMLEAQSAGRLDHPNIVPVHDVILEGEQPFIIMRFVEGKSLDQTVSSEGPLPAHVVARIGVQLLDALGAAHSADVIHRDVKPHNVLIQLDGTAQLTDFSIASVFGTETLTKTGALLGSPGYIAPERLMNGETTPAGDLFALGATLFFAAEGIGPFTAKETIAGLFASATRPHPRPKHAGPRLTPVIDGLLEKSPAERLDRPRARALLKNIADAPDEDEPETRSGEFVPPPLGRVDTDDNPVRRGAAAAPGAPQGDPASDSSTAVFASTRLRSNDSGDVARPVSGAAPVSGGTVYGRPVSGAQRSGAPVSGGPVSGAPSSSRQGLGGAVYGRPISGAPVSSGSVYGRPVSGAPVSGSPASSGAGPVSGGRELAWGPGAVAGGPPNGGPPSFRPPTAATSPPAGQRWKRALAVLTIVVLGLGAGIIANLVATQDRAGKANRAGNTIEGTGVSDDDEPTTAPTPGAATPSNDRVEPSPTGTRPEPSPSTTSAGPTKLPPVPTVLSASISAPAEMAPKDCTAPLEVAVEVRIVVSDPARVTWTAAQAGGDVHDDVFTTADSPETISPSYRFTQAKPATGTLRFTLTVTSPDGASAKAAEVQVTCPASDPTTSPPVSTPNGIAR